MVDSNKVRFHQKATTSTNGACSPVCGDLKSPPKVHRGQTPADTRSVSLDAGKDDIIDRIWPGSHDIQHVTHFVMTNFAGHWTAYLHFSQWADSRELTDPDNTICVDDWLQTKPSKEDSLREDTVVGTRYCLGSLGGIVTDNNMCNKTCLSLPLHIGDGISTPRSNKTPTKHFSLVTHHTNIRTPFLAAARVRTCQDQATEQEVEEGIPSQEAKEQASAARVEVLREHFATAAREKISKENEVHWLPDASDISTGSLDTLMEDADTIAPKGRNRGSKSRKATKIDRLNAQIKKQERLANTAQVLATSLQATPLGANTPITSECSPMMSDTPGTTPNKTCNRACYCQIWWHYVGTY